MPRFFIWTGIDAWRCEAASVEVRRDRLTAEGVQIGVEPLPYRLDYRLDTTDDFVTTRFDGAAGGDGWERRLTLERDASGVWRCDATSAGSIDLPPPGGDPGPFHEALDCDLAFSPLTNVMPVRRHDLHQASAAAELLMVWISVPDLSIDASTQAYEHVTRAEDRATVRSRSGSFSADLLLDAEGFVVEYPGLARRVS